MCTGMRPGTVNDRACIPVIKAVLFDLFETLVTESHVAPTRASSLAPALGLERQAYRPEWKARRPRIVVGALSFADALMEISQTLAGTVDAAAVHAICEQRIREKVDAFARIDDQIKTLIAGLADRHIRARSHQQRFQGRCRLGGRLVRSLLRSNARCSPATRVSPNPIPRSTCGPCIDWEFSQTQRSISVMAATMNLPAPNRLACGPIVPRGSRRFRRGRYLGQN